MFATNCLPDELQIRKTRETGVTQNVNIELDESGTLESKLQALELQDRSIQEVVEVDIGEIDDPKYGKTHLKATLPVLSKFKEPNFQKFAEVRQFFIDFLFDRGVIWSSKELKYIDWGIINACYGQSHRQLDSSEVKAMIAVNITLFYIDDLMDQGFVSDNVETSGAFESVLERLYQDIEDPSSEKKYRLAESVPALQPLVYLMTFANELVMSVVPGYNLKESYTMGSIRDAAICQYVLQNPSLKNGLSIAGFKAFRRYEICIEGPIEFIAALNGIRLKPGIRDSILFKILVQLYNSMYGYMNDLLGILKDIASEDMNNIILRRVRRGEMSLEAAVKHHNEQLIDELRDYVILSKKICQDNPDDEDLEAYLEIVKDAYTQTVFLAQGLQNRYLLEKASFVVRDVDLNSPFGI